MLLWGFNARASLLLSISNCSVLLVLKSKVLTFSKFRMEKIFVGLNFHILKFCVKYAKFCTIRKFPAIRYVTLLWESAAYHSRCYPKTFLAGSRLDYRW